MRQPAIAVQNVDGATKSPDAINSHECPNPGDYAFKSTFRPRRALTVGEIGALSDFDNVTVRIADVAAYLAVLGDRLRDELGSSAFP